MLLKMALRNIFRQKRRTILTILMMFFGHVLVSFTIAFETGTYDQMISMFTDSYVGHVQIHSPKYVDSPSMYETIIKEDELKKQLEKNSSVRSYSFRLKGGGLVSFKTKTFGAEVFGVNFEQEQKTTGISQRIAVGKLPQKDIRNQVIIGGKLSKLLGAKLGDEIILISQAADGSIANDLFQVSGIFTSDAGSKDDFRLYMKLIDAQEFYALYSQSHEVAIGLKSMRNIDLFIKQMIGKTENTIRSWMEIEKDFYKAMQADRKGSDVTFFIIMFIVGMGVLNTILMATLERTREFGVLKAIGTTSTNISLLIILETIFISLIAIVLGSIVSTFLNLYFQENGISLGESFTYGGVTFDVMYAHINLKCYLIPALIILITSLVVSIYPGYKASRVSPIDAMREF